MGLSDRDDICPTQTARFPNRQSAMSGLRPGCYAYLCPTGGHWHVSGRRARRPIIETIGEEDAE